MRKGLEGGVGVAGSRELEASFKGLEPFFKSLGIAFIGTNGRFITVCGIDFKASKVGLDEESVPVPVEKPRFRACDRVLDLRCLHSGVCTNNERPDVSIRPSV